MPSGSLIRFGAFELELDTSEIRKNGRSVKLPPQPFRILVLLASSPGHLVTRETIRKELWGNDTFVDFESGLNFCIRKIRRVLGDNAKKPRFIETLPRRGYRFVFETSNHQDEPIVAEARTGFLAGSPPTACATAGQRSNRAIGVLEFQNLSGDPDIDWLATGIAESLAADLRRLPSVWVVSSERVRATLQQLSKLEPPQPQMDYKLLGHELGAEWIVTGSYQRAGNRLRITPLLVEVCTGEVISSGKVDGTWEEIFELQDRLAGELIEVLELTAAGKKRHVAVGEVRHLQAYEQYSRARRRFRQMDKGTLDDALQHFGRALDLDPQYAMAHAGLGATHAMRFIHRTNPDDLVQATSHLERACQLDGELAEPYPWLCYIYMRDGKLHQALDAGHRAVELLPDLVQAHYFLALVYFLFCETDPSHYQNAANHLLQAARVEPRWQATWFVLSFLSLLNGNYSRAEEFADRLLQSNADAAGATKFIGAEVLLATICLRRGNYQKALGWLSQSMAKLAASDHMYREGMMALSSCVLGDIHLRQEKPDVALVDYRRAWHTVQEYPTMLAQDRHGVRALAGLAAAYAAQSERDRSDELLSRAGELLETAKRPQSAAAGANVADLHYALAVAHIRGQNKGRALDSLDWAVKTGWRDVAWFDRDSELQPLLDEPRFLQLRERLRQFPQLQLELSTKRPEAS
jgi:DNA-binding winged helix-turn-helix (wHTH) protein/tetratricopeptide (TPR) repeat protein